jgi:Domain of unknown function (DUF4397)/LysM domain
VRTGDRHPKLLRHRRRAGAWLLLFLCANVVLPAQALASAFLRIVHAVPGAGAASLNIKSGAKTLTLGPVSFGQASGESSVPSGPFSWTLTAGGKTLFSGTGRLGKGSYTGVLMYKGSGMSVMGVMLHIYRNHAATPGHSAIRFIHAAPELGNPTLKFDGRTVASDLAFMMATPYLSVSPGAHSADAYAPGRKAPILTVDGLKLQSGVAYSAIVVGTRGQAVRVVTVTNRGAPLTRPSAPPSSDPASSRSSSDPATVVVAPGDSLWKIAAAHVAPGADNSAVYAEVIRIWNANASRIGTGDPNMIFPGTRLSIPR